MVFTLDQATRLTGFSRDRLAQWDKSEFFRPEASLGESGRAFSRLYTFRDIVGLRVIAHLLDRGVSVRELRKLGKWLRAAHEKPWSSLRFWVAGKRVVFDDPETGKQLEARPRFGQRPLEFDLAPIVSDAETAVTELHRRRSEDLGHTQKRRHVAGGAEVFSGTRIPVSAVLDMIRLGYPTEYILNEFPRLERTDIEAVADRVRASA